MTTTSTDAGAPRSSAWPRWIGLALLALILAATLPSWTSRAYEASDETNDASIYVATARALLAGDGYRYFGEPFIVRPPGFAVIVAAAMRAFGESWYALNLVVGVFGALACLFLYELARPRVGVVVAFLLALGLWLHPDLRRASNQVMSDVPGLALVLGCLLVERWASSARSPARDVVLAFAIAASAYVRSIALLLVPAILLARWLARGGERWTSFLRGRAMVLVLVVAACMAPWSVRCALRHPTPPVDQTHLYSYGTAMLHERPWDPASPIVAPSALLQRVSARAEPLVASLERSERAPRGEELEPLAHWLAVCAGAVLLAAAAWLLVERRRASEAFVLIVALFLLAYFAFRPRLVLPLQALLPMVFVEALLAMGVRGRAATARWVVVVFAAVLALRNALTTYERRDDSGVVDVRHAQYLAAASALRPALDDRPVASAPVASAIGWHWSAYLDRPVFTLALAGKRDGAAGIEAVLAKRAIATVILADFLPEDRALVPYFRARWGAERRVGDVSVFTRPR